MNELQFFFAALVRAKDNVHLGEEKKKAIKQLLLGAIEGTMPVPYVRVKNSPRHIVQRPFTYIPLRKPMPIAAFIIASTLLGGGASFAAQHALPGELLYPVKIHVNETVGAALAFTDAAKAGWEAHIAHERIAEAGALAARGSLNEQTEASLAAQFNESALQAESDIRNLNAGAHPGVALDIASHFEASLNADIRVLMEAGFEDTGSAKAAIIAMSNEGIKALASLRAIRTEKETELTSQDHNQNADLKMVARGTLISTGNAIVSFNTLLSERAHGATDVAADAEAQANLKNAQQLLGEASTTFDAGRYGESLTFSNQAIRLIEESRALIEVHLRLDLEAPGGVHLETASGHGGTTTTHASSEEPHDASAGGGHTTIGGEVHGETQVGGGNQDTGAVSSTVHIRVGL